MLRLLSETEEVVLEGERISCAFAVDQQTGIVRRYLHDDQGNLVFEGGRIKVETLYGKVSVRQQEAKQTRKPSMKGGEKADGNAAGDKPSNDAASGPPGGSKGRGSGTARENAG